MPGIRNADQDSRTSGSGWTRLVAGTRTGAVCRCEERRSSFEREGEACPSEEAREVRA
jgi:hypothetical protein